MRKLIKIIVVFAIFFCFTALSINFVTLSDVEKKDTFSTENMEETILQKDRNLYDQNFLGDSDITLLDWNEKEIELKYTIPELIIEEINSPIRDVYHRLSINGGGCLYQIGHPRIPFRTLKILLPYGKDMKDIGITVGEKIILEGKYKIEPAQAQIPIGSKQTPEYTLDESVYDSVDSFPEELYSVVGIYELRGYKILVLNLYPVHYIPKTGKISYFNDIKVLVSLAECIEGNLLFRGMKKDEERVIRTVDNPQLIDSYIKGTSLVKTLDFPMDLPPGSYDYIIITNEALNSSSGTYTFQDLADSKNAQGIQTKIITVEFIYSNYPGADDQEKIRNFIIDAYSTWGIEYVLLGGDGDGDNLGGESENPIIPSRGFNASVGSYKDNNIISDLYYAALNGTWNDDGDQYWGEPGEDDLYAEVYVGRAPVDSEEELSNFVMKTLLHESVIDPYLFKALMVGENLGWTMWGGDYKDEIKDGSDLYGYTTVGFPGMYNVETLYDRDAIWDKNDLMSLINNGVHIINHLGHADVDYAMKMDNPDADSLTNEKYFFAYSQGCYDGAFDNRDTSSTYHDYDCILEHFVATSNGAFAFIGNSRYGWGHRYTTEGASQHYDREFFDAIFEESIEEIGRANQDSKEDSIGFIDPSNPMRWCYYELNLFGDPTATISINVPHDVSVSLEIPTISEINNNYIVNATVTNNGNNDETNVDFFLYLDDMTVASTTIPTLYVDESVTIDYVWAPTECKIYNFTAYVPAVPGEIYIWNNNITEFVRILDFSNYIMNEENPYEWIDASSGTELFLSDDGYSTETLPFSFPFYNETFSTIYLGSNGYLSFSDSTPSDWSNDLIPSSDSDNIYLIAPFWDDLQPASGGGGGTIYIQSFDTYWVAEWLDIEHLNGNLVGTFELILHENGDIVFNYDYLDYTNGGYTCGLNLGLDTSYYNTYQDLNELTDDFSIRFTNSTNNFSPALSMGSVSPPTGDQTTQFNFSVTYTDQDNDPPLYINTLINGIPHQMEKQDSFDLNYIDGCTYQYLTYLQPGDYNYMFECYDGFYDSTDVQWLTVSEKENENPPVLSNGQVNPGTGQTNSTIFTFSVNYADADNNEPKFINVTINSTTYSLNKQNISDNNYMDGCLYACKIAFMENGTYTHFFTCFDGIFADSDGPHSGPLVLKKGQLFEGMYISHNLTLQGIGTGYSNFSYSYDSNNIFNVFWDNWILDGSWDVNEKIRIISNSVGMQIFDGSHTPAWIFTNVSINDTIPISVINDGDHNFNVTGELIYELPGFSLVEVWILEDLSYPNRIVWYEKSTGILLNGTFYSLNWGFNYSFDLFDTNVVNPPLNPFIIINNGDATTDSTLVTLTLSADGAEEMRFRHGTTATWTNWESYSTIKQINLPGSINNTKYTIYVEFRNITGETDPVYDSILYLRLFPLNPSIVINNGDASTDNQLVNLTLSADGATEMCFRNGTTGTWTSWESYGTTKQLYLAGSTNNTEYTIYVKFRNAIGETSPVSDDILFLITEDGDGDGDGETIIPGYPLEFLIISLIGSIGIVLLFKKKRRLN